MTITKIKKENELTIALEGKLDTITSPDLEEFLNKELDGVEHLIFDMDKLDYISSAGLRLLLSACKKIRGEGGTMKLINVGEGVDDVLMMTGFRRAFTIETKLGIIYNPELS